MGGGCTGQVSGWRWGGSMLGSPWRLCALGKLLKVYLNACVSPQKSDI